MCALLIGKQQQSIHRKKKWMNGTGTGKWCKPGLNTVTVMGVCHCITDNLTKHLWYSTTTKQELHTHTHTQMYVSNIWEYDKSSEALSSPLKSPGSTFPQISCDTPKIGEILNATQQYVTMKAAKKLLSYSLEIHMPSLWRSLWKEYSGPRSNNSLCDSSAGTEQYSAQIQNGAFLSVWVQIRQVLIPLWIKLKFLKCRGIQSYSWRAQLQS